MSAPVPPPPPPQRPSGPPKAPTPPQPVNARAEATFNSAIERPAAEREAFIAGACGEDAEMHAEVRALLSAHEAAGDFMPDDTPLSPELEEQLARLKPEEAGDRIGPYKLLQEIGQGGFGTVWMADQEKPVRRRVALKIIKMGMDTKEVIARFEQERQALAMMDHPNIARVFDAGATQYGRPFFVMELVRGVKITDYCDEQGLSTAERIGLFISVCQAVQHAHQKGIIHRDLKPSNILVTINDGEAVPKVIDFGVAKATQGHLTDGTLFTKFEQMIGTPLYMSPEQAEMTSLDVDTRSDIYALGVLLYELLTGRTPIDTVTMAQAGMDEIRRLIREVDPPRPSQRLKTLDGNELTTMAKRRHAEAAKLPGALRGDLDWIVMKCLEKDRKRRYDTANGLALDLQRHLKNEVVIARPPTTAYLLSKLVRRNKSAVAAGCTVALALIVGFAVAVWQARRAESEAKRSATALDELRATAPAFAEQARGLAAKEQYNDAIAKLDYAIKLRPGGAEFLVAKADLLQCQFRLAEAAAIYREALRVKPDLARVEASVKLCDELLAAPTGPDGKLTRESLGKLRIAMLRQQRPAAELLPVARLLGAEKEHLVAYWLDRLKDLPISPEKPLKDRLTVREDSLLELDLKQTLITDLSALAGMPLGKLSLGNCRLLADFAPLREFRSLTYLDLDYTQITNLSVLRGLPLEMLFMVGTKVSDLSPLRGMKLKKLVLGCPRVSDLSPLEGMPLTLFVAMDLANGTDFSPLKGLPLESCMIMRCAITDLSFLSACPLKELGLYIASPLRGLGWLNDIKTLERLVLPSNFRSFSEDDLQAIAALRNHPRLAFIQADSTSSNETYSSWHLLQVSQSKEIFWRDWDREQAFLPAIRAAGFTFSLTKLPDDTYYLQIEKQPLRDLSFLKGAPISALWIGATKVTDLSPIADLPLRSLGIWSTDVTDISPLRGMRLEELSLGTGAVADLSPLAGMPLQKLYMHQCKAVGDLGPIHGLKTLQSLTVPVTARNIESLRSLKNLKWLGFRGDTYATANSTPAELFWERWPGMAWSRALNESGMRYSANENADGTWKVTVTSRGFSDCSIFKGASIRELDLKDTSVADFRPLEGLALTKLSLERTRVTDLSPLRAPTLSASLRELHLWGTKVADFSPLAACTNLTVLGATETSLADLSVLRGRQLRELRLQKTSVTDISVLAGMPLTFLTLHGTAVTDLSPLLQCPSLRQLTLPEGARNMKALSALPALAAISFDTDGEGKIVESAEDFWKRFDNIGWRAALWDAGIKPQRARLLGDGSWDIRLTDTKTSDLALLKGANISRLWLDRSQVDDLGALRNLPLKQLWIFDGPFSDLGPLEGMALDLFQMSGGPVTDLTPLRGMPLTVLSLGEFKGSDISALRGMPLVELRMNRCIQVTDLSPLADCKTLEAISIPPSAQNIELLRDLPKLRLISYRQRKDSQPDQSAEEFWKEYDDRRILSAIAGVAGRFKKLDDGGWEVDLGKSDFRDLKPLAGLPITSLNLGATAIVDLTPLRGLPLKKLTLFDTKVTDLIPLEGMPLEELNLRGTSVADLSPLRGMPLTSLRLQGSGVTGLSPLAGCKTLVTLVLPAGAKEVELLRSFPNLERLSYEARQDGLPRQSAEEFWKEYDELAWLRALPFAVNRVKKLPDGSWDIDFHGAQISDLAVLRGKRISKLGLGNTAVTDLSPLRDMPLVHLNLYNTKITDLSPLAGMRLDRLSFSGTEVTDISVLRGMPLTTIRMHNCKKLTDLSPLAGLKDLAQLTLPPNAKDIEFLRDPAKFPKLKRISFIENPANHQPDKTAAEFWKAYDAKKK